MAAKEESLRESLQNLTVDNLNMGSLNDCVNMTTSHFCYQSYQQKPPAVESETGLTKEDEIRLELQRQEIDDVIKYIESDAVPGKSKNRRKRKHNQIKAAAAAAAAQAAEKEEEAESDADKASTEEQKVDEGQEESVTEVTKKKKRRRKNKRSKKEEKDEESGNEAQTDKIINLEYIEECSTQAGGTQSLCLSKLSDVEFDQSMSEFV